MKRSQEKYNGKNCQSHNKLKQAWNDTRHPHSRQSKVARNSKLRNACCVQMIKEKFLNAQINKEREKRTKKSTHTHWNPNKPDHTSQYYCVCMLFFLRFTWNFLCFAIHLDLSLRPVKCSKFAHFTFPCLLFFSAVYGLYTDIYQDSPVA